MLAMLPSYSVGLLGEKNINRRPNVGLRKKNESCLCSVLQTRFTIDNRTIEYSELRKNRQFDLGLQHHWPTVIRESLTSGP